MADAQQGGSQASHPAAGIATVYVLWPGEAQKAEHDDPGDKIVAYTEVEGQMLDFQRVGLGNTLRLNAQNEHQPNSNLLLVVSVPRGSNIDVQARNYQ